MRQPSFPIFSLNSRRQTKIKSPKLKIISIIQVEVGEIGNTHTNLDTYCIQGLLLKISMFVDSLTEYFMSHLSSSCLIHP